MVRRAAFIWIILIHALLVHAQSEHQRLGVEKQKVHSLTVSADLSFSSSGLYGYEIFSLNSSLGLQYMYDNRLYAAGCMPFSVTAEADAESVRPVRAAPGDPSLSAGYIFRIGDVRLRMEANYSFPLGIWNPYQASEVGIVSGSGFHRTGAAVSVSRILDPVVLNGTLGCGIGLPREERFGWTMDPGSLFLSLSITEVLNDRTGYRIGVTNRLGIPWIRNGLWDKDGPSYSLSLSFSVFYQEEHLSVETGIDKDMSRFSESPAVNAGLSYEFRKEPEDEE
jgi:hypothetical protein